MFLCSDKLDYVCVAHILIHASNDRDQCFFFLDQFQGHTKCATRKVEGSGSMYGVVLKVR